MKYFTEDYLNFFKELAANNNRDWFHDNKKRYERSVKEPFKIFVQDIISRTAELDGRFSIDVKDAIFRINRDVRFSKDKSPYKLQMGAVIAPGGKKEGMGIPGMYLELGPEHFRFYSGIYMPSKEDLYKIRAYMSKHSSQLNSILNHKEFVEHFGELRGEKNKVLPKEFKSAAETQPLLFNKQFYFFSSMPPETILREDLDDVIFGLFKVSEPMREYLTKALAFNL